MPTGKLLFRQTLIGQMLIDKNLQSLLIYLLWASTGEDGALSFREKLRLGNGKNYSMDRQNFPWHLGSLYMTFSYQPKRSDARSSKSFDFKRLLRDVLTKLQAM